LKLYNYIVQTTSNPRSHLKFFSLTFLDNPDVAAFISEKNWRARDNKDWGGAKTTPIRPREEFTRETDFKVSYH
jgi:hypothetical protein